METAAPTGHCGGDRGDHGDHGDHHHDHGDDGDDGDQRHHYEEQEEEEEEEEDAALVAWDPAPGGLAVTLSEAGRTVSCAPGSALWQV